MELVTLFIEQGKKNGAFYGGNDWEFVTAAGGTRLYLVLFGHKKYHGPFDTNTKLGFEGTKE